jgi:phage baseplate assembly protein V
MGATQDVSAAVRVGIVESTKPEKVTVRVKIPDLDNLISYDLQVLQRKTREDKDYWMPDLQEEVLCLFLGNGLECGFVLGALYNKEDKPPANSQDKRCIVFKDGTRLEYDRKEHRLTADVKGDVVVSTTGNITAYCNNAEVNAMGSVSISGNGGVSLNPPGAATVTKSGKCCCAGSCKSDYKDACCSCKPSSSNPTKAKMRCNGSCSNTARTNTLMCKPSSVDERFAKLCVRN